MKKGNSIALTSLGEFTVSFGQILEAAAENSSFSFNTQGREQEVRVLSYFPLKNEWNLLINNRPFTVIKTEQGQYALKNSHVSVNLIGEQIYKLQQHQQLHKKQKSNETIKAQMPGLIIDIKVKAGDSVKKGQGLLVLEAMKMQNEIKSPQDGIVEKIAVKMGDNIKSGESLVVLKIVWP